MKRTKNQKIKAQARHVNSQLSYRFDKTYSQISKNKESINTVQSSSLGSIKKDLYKSLIIATLILISLMVVYWSS